MTAEILLRGVLGLLAAYHLGMGLVSTFAPRAAARIGGALYAIEAAETPQLRYGVRMLGLYALAFGGLLVLATMDPRRYVAVVVAAAALQLARAIARLALRRELAEAFPIGGRRNAVNAAVLLAVAATLAICLVLAR